MFGFSISKVLLTAFAIAAVWYGWKWINRVQARRRGEFDEFGRRSVGKGPGPRAKRHGRGVETEDLVQCKACGAYVPAAGGGGCDRPDCPIPR